MRGRFAEAVARFYLRVCGYRVLEKNHKHKAGEVDIIARKGKLIVFVEVKYRRNLALAPYPISYRQWRRIENAARLYLASTARHEPDIARCNWRFDAILIAPFRFPLHIKGAYQREKS